MIELKKSQELFKTAENLIPGGVNSPVRAFQQVGGSPIYIKSAKGNGFVDADNNTFVDYCLSWGPLILGHSHPSVVEAVQKAAVSGLSYGACHKGEIQLAERILAPFRDFNRVRLVNSGTEAVMTALRIARGYTGRDLVVKFDGGYHGHFDGMLVKAGSGLATHSIASSNGIPQDIAQTTIVLPLDDDEALQELFLEKGEQIAAVIIEPLPANNGLLIQRKEFLQSIRDTTAKYGSLLIFDEVISGFRLQYGAYWQMVGIRPDIFTLGKIIGGGMPVGAIVGTDQIMDKLSPVGNVYQAGTLSGNPVSLAAGNATLKILEEESPYDQLDKLGKEFAATLEQSGISYIRTQQIGSLLWLYLDDTDFPRRADNISPLAMERFTKIYWSLLNNGFYLPPSSYEVLFLSSAHSTSDVKNLATTIIDELKQLND